MVKAGDSWMELVADWVMSVSPSPTVRQEPSVGVYVVWKALDLTIALFISHS
jgi:hypothetical protein